MDIRVERTRKMLFDALEELLENRSFSSITVSEICDLSTVRRATFYRHFEDKTAFFDAYLQSITERFLAQAREADDVDDLATYARAMHERLIGFVEAHPDLARANMGRSTEVGTIDLIVAEVGRGISEFATRDAAWTGGNPPMPADFFAMFYAGGMIHTLRWWIIEGKPISAAELADYTMAFLEPCMEQGKRANAAS